MKLLIVGNIVLPKASILIGNTETSFGGWLTTIVEGLKKVNGIEIAVISPAHIDNLKSGYIDGIQYYILPKNGPFDINATDLQTVFNEFEPDLVHIEGSEFKHANTVIKTWSGKRVVSLQGVINGHVNYYDGLLPQQRLLGFFSLPYVIAMLSIFFKKSILKSRLKWEQETLRQTDNILGRTDWDKHYAKQLNPGARYFSVNRILRKEFEDIEWEISNINRHSIYIGNSYQPLKGAHFVIEAVSLLKKDYPDIKLSIAGPSPYDSKVKKNLVKNGYAYYLRSIIRKLGLEENIEFLGTIKPDDVMNRLLKSHVYILGSIIENSPNSLGEAMLLGVPTVASFVGGVQSMTSDKTESLLYRAGEVISLVGKIREVFESDELALELSENSKRRARINHDEKENIDLLVKCYETILEYDIT